MVVTWALDEEITRALVFATSGASNVTIFNQAHLFDGLDLILNHYVDIFSHARHSRRAIYL